MCTGLIEAEMGSAEYQNFAGCHFVFKTFSSKVSDAAS